MARKGRSIDDYVLGTPAGPVRLSRLFGRHDHLVVLHNMGTSCPNCTLWADEFNGMTRNLEKAAGFCIVSPDDAKTQAACAKSRGWTSKMASAKGTSFIKDLGYEDRDGNALPGISILAKSGRDLTVLDRVRPSRKGRCPSVLEVIWMIPDAEPAEIAWGKRRRKRTR